MAKSLIYLLIIFVTVFLLDSCTAKKIVLSNNINNPLFEKTLKILLNDQYPDSFALSQRILLNVAGKQYDFIGQLTMNRYKAFRAMAFGEMGGQFIDLLTKKDSVSILGNPTGLPEKPIMQGVVEDIKQAFYYHNVKNLTYSDLANGLIKTTIKRSEGDQLIYLINSNNNKILNLNYYSGNKHIRSAEFLEYNRYNGWDREIPSYIKLTNYRWHYSMEIRLLKFNTQYNADKVFNVNPDV